MQLTLKNLKIHDDMSEETPCFSASIYVDGKRAGTVSNRGVGGCNDYVWQSREIQQAVTTWAAAQPTKYEMEKLDQIIDDLMVATEVRRDLVRHTRRETLFRLVGDAPDSWRTVKAPFSPDVRMFLVTKYGPVGGDRLMLIVNEDLDAAVRAEIVAAQAARRGQP